MSEDFGKAHRAYEDSCDKAVVAMIAVLERLRPTEFPERGCWAYAGEPEFADLELSYIQASVALAAAWRHYEHRRQEAEASPPKQDRTS